MTAREARRKLGPRKERKKDRTRRTKLDQRRKFRAAQAKRGK